MNLAVKTYQIEELPINHSVLNESFSNQYKRANDKISYMAEKGELIPLVKGYYVFANPSSRNLFLSYNISNMIYGPSYVSRYSALSYHGLLSESVISIEAMTMKRSNTIENKKGIFDFIHLSEDVFSIGIQSINKNSTTTFLMASPEKALCDLIWTSPSLPLQNIADMQYFLEEDLRFDMDFFRKANITIFEECFEYGKKKNLIKYFIRFCKMHQK